MAQINLLKQSNNNEALSGIFSSVVVKVLIVVLVVLIGYYGWVAWQIRNTNNDIAQATKSIQDANQAIAGIQGKDELVTRQGQLKELGTIIANHPYWSAFLAELARVTLKTASYLSIQTLDDGHVSLIVSVPAMADLDKFLQVFNDPDFNQNFSDIKIDSVGTVQKADKIYYQFGVKMQYDTGLLQYSAQSKGQ